MTSTSQPLIGALGDLIEDIVVDLAEPIRHATDSTARIRHCRGGSAANVAVAAVVAGGRACFLGTVGADRLGDELLHQLTKSGVEARVERSGHTGTVVALIDHEGERSLLTDRGSAERLSAVPEKWLDDLAVLHVPAYSFTSEPLASAAEAALQAARGGGASTSIDASAVPVIESLGPAGFLSLIERTKPSVLFCNRDEADALAVSGALCGATLTVVKDGQKDAVIYEAGADPIYVPALRVPTVVDTTGAGDAFAGGFLVGLALGHRPADCVSLGHDLAALSIAKAGSLQGDSPDSEQR